MSTVKKKKADELKTPWRLGEPSQFGRVQVFDRTNNEVCSCNENQAKAIVSAINWCAQRGYLK